MLLWLNVCLWGSQATVVVRPCTWQIPAPRVHSSPKLRSSKEEDMKITNKQANEHYQSHLILSCDYLIYSLSRQDYIQLGSYVTRTGPRWKWFSCSGLVIQSQSVSVKLGARVKEPHWTAERQVFPPVNHAHKAVQMMQDFSRDPQGGSGWRRA